MKKRSKIELAGRLIAVLGVVFVSSPALGGEGDASPNWREAGREIKEAAKAVGEASKETWQLTKEKGAEAWRETKETTADAVRKTKKKIHDATAPKNSQKEPEQGLPESAPTEPGAAPQPEPGPEAGEPAPVDPGTAPEFKEPEPTEPQMPEPAPQGHTKGADGAGRQAI